MEITNEPGMGTSSLEYPAVGRCTCTDPEITCIVHPSRGEGHHPVDKPNHYMVAGIEVRDIQRELSVAFTGQDASDFNNAVKYLLRSPKKGKLVEDLKKCRKHITWLIESFGGSDAKD